MVFIILGVFLVLAWYFTRSEQCRNILSGFLSFDVRTYFIAVCEELCTFTFAHKGVEGGYNTTRQY